MGKRNKETLALADAALATHDKGPRTRVDGWVGKYTPTQYLFQYVVKFPDRDILLVKLSRLGHY